MAIQMRRGNEADLDISKLKAGEIAICLDSKKMIVKLTGDNYLTLTDMPSLISDFQNKINAVTVLIDETASGLESDFESRIQSLSMALNKDYLDNSIEDINSKIAAILSIQHISSWKDIQTLVRAGLADKVFSIGDQLTCKRGDTTLVWDIIGIDHDTPTDSQFTHSMTLQLHDCIYSMQYNVAQALYYCQSALAAGTYHFTLLPNYDTNYGGGKTYQFTLTKSVPKGGQICFPWISNTQASSTQISTYKSYFSTDVIESVSITEGSSGTDLGIADGSISNINHTHRVRFGGNNWQYSAIRQWLNSEKAAGSVWTPKTSFDRPPSWRSDTAGFLYGMDADFLDVIGAVEKVTDVNTITDGGSICITNDRFFLLSTSEVYINSNTNEGKPYPYYSDYSALSAAGTGDDSNRIKYYNGTAQYWWLRTPTANSACAVFEINPSGARFTGRPINNNIVCPACCIV